ncbi:MAG: hypothetical protein AABY15_00700 [Nanoarchaeota archaeon]
MDGGNLIHCEGIVSCVEPEEVGYVEENNINADAFRKFFFSGFGLDYIMDYCLANNIHFHIATHSRATKTCKEKAAITGLPLERVIKGFYLEDRETGKIYALAIPGEFGYSISKLSGFLGLSVEEGERRIAKADESILPLGIKYGTVHPFPNGDVFKDIKLENILFDANFVRKRSEGNGLDDFSFTAHPRWGYDNFRLSIQMKYNHAKEILENKFGKEIVREIELV